MGSARTKFGGFLATSLGVAIGTITGAVGSAFLGFFIGLAVLAITAGPTIDTDIDAELGINILAGLIAGPVIGVATAYFTRQLLARRQPSGIEEYGASGETAWAAGILNGCAVLAAFLITAFGHPTFVGDLVGRVWAWPLWFAGVALFARWIALASASRRSS